MAFEFDPNSVSNEPPAEPAKPKRASSWGPWLVAILLLVAVGEAAWWYLNRPLPGPAPTGPAPAPAVPLNVDAEGPAVPDAQANAIVAGWVGRLLDHADPRWTSGGDLSRRIAGVIAAFANDEDPRSFLLPLAPTAAFKVESRQGQTVISPASYARFDWAAKQLATLHVEKVGDAWKEIRPLVASAWREIAPKGSSLDDAVARALSKVLATPVPEAPVPVVAHGAVYQFADPKLESLAPAQKLLIRLGPANEKIVQDQARKIGEALGVPAAH